MALEEHPDRLSYQGLILVNAGRAMAPLSNSGFVHNSRILWLYGCPQLLSVLELRNW